MSDASQNRTTGTATSRLRGARKAVRRQTKARLAISGPSGAGKTWTSLGVAERIGAKRNEDGRVTEPARILVIDTEPGDGNQGASELYADQFEFDVIEWDPPYDPRDLSLTITDAGKDYDVIIIDSASHFWRGAGGTLDIADGKFGGWKTATPVQDAMLDAILRCQAHVIVCTRARQAYVLTEVEKNGRTSQKVEKLGMAPIQRDDMEYEFQVVLTIDGEHRIDVGKTRAALLAGKSYHANDQGKFADDFGGWLEAGIQFVRQADADAIKLALDAISDDGRRKQVKTLFVGEFDKPEQLTEDRLPEVWAWLSGEMDVSPHPFVEVDGLCGYCLTMERARWHDDDAPTPAHAVADEDVDQSATSEPTEPADEPGEPEATSDAPDEPHTTTEHVSDEQPDTRPPTDAEIAAGSDLDDQVEHAKQTARERLAAEPEPASLLDPEPEGEQVMAGDVADDGPLPDSVVDAYVAEWQETVAALPDKRSLVNALAAHPADLSTAGTNDVLRQRLLDAGHPELFAA